MSTGADPGPACYGKGGREPTVSDANLALGRLPEELIGGGMRLDPCQANKAIAPLAAKLGLSLRETALGIVRIVNANMMRAIRVVSIERGHDPRSFTLLPFGGAGALHAVKSRASWYPPRSCARGAGHSVRPGGGGSRYGGEFRCHLPCTARWRSAPVAAAYARLLGAAWHWHGRERLVDMAERQDGSIDMRYVGQNFELAIAIPQGQGFPPSAWLKSAFLEAHQRNTATMIRRP